MGKQIRDFPIKNVPASADLLLIQDSVDSAYKSVQASSFASSGSPSSGGTPTANLTTTGLLIDYRFDDEQGATVTDHSGNNLNGSLVNCTWMGPNRNGIYLDGNSGYVNLPPHPYGNQTYSIEALVCPTNPRSWERIVDWGVPNSGAFWLAAPNDNNQISCSNLNLSYGHYSPVAGVAAFKWYHVVSCFTNGLAYLFVNGFPVAGNTNVVAQNVASNWQTSYLGKSNYSDPLFTGVFAAFRYYDQHYLSCQEIANNLLFTVQFQQNNAWYIGLS